jgi:hypothetical protein
LVLGSSRQSRADGGIVQFVVADVAGFLRVNASLSGKMRQNFRLQVTMGLVFMSSPVASHPSGKE